MLFSSEQVELITQQVLRRLRARGVLLQASGVPASVQPVSAGTDVVSGTVAGDAEICLPGVVITERELQSAGAAGRSVRVADEVVITPSGREFIRRNKVQLRRISSSTGSQDRLLLVLIGRQMTAETAGRSVGWNPVSVCDSAAAVQLLTEETRRPAVTCGGVPSVISCLLNRNSAVRAAVIPAPGDLDEIQTQMNPDVYCVNAARWTVTDLTLMLRDISTRDTGVPAAWKEPAR